MPLFQVLTYLAPLLAAIGLASALALTADRPPLRRLAVAGIVAGGVVLLLGGASLAGSFAHFLPAALLALTFGLLVAGLYLLAESAGLPREAAQLLGGLAALLLMGSIDVFGPGLVAAAESGTPYDVTFRRISWVLQVNPHAVAAYGIFGVDLLNTPAFYTTIKLAEYPHEAPRLGPAALGYALAGAALIAASAGVRCFRRRRAGAP